MSEHFAEATVHITPKLGSFVTDLDALLKKAMLNVKTPVVRIAPALTKNFIGSLREQVNEGVLRAQKGVKPIIIRTIIEAPSRRQLTNLAQAPVRVSGVAAPIGPREAIASVTGNQETIQNRINQGLARGGVLLGDLEKGEKEVTRAARVRGVVAKQTETRAQQAARAEALSQQASKKGSEAPFVAASKSGTELTQARAVLKEQTDRLNLAEQARGISLTKVTRDEHEAAKSARSLAFERVQSLEAAGTVTPSVGTTRPTAVSRARTVGVATLRSSVQGLRDASAASEKLGKDTKDLAGAQDILHTRTTALTDANRTVKASFSAQSDTLKVAALNAQKLAQADVAASKTQIAAIKQQAKENSAGARNAAQLSRGGQATILSLAGIRGATLAASRSFLVGAAAITIFAKAVKSFADLEVNLDVFRATTAATAAQMEKVREESRKLGADLTLPGVSAADAADAMVELAKAGLSVQDSITAARGVLQLATAAAIDNAAATQLVANALNAFQLAGTDASKVADTFANAANAAQGSIADIGTAFQQASAAGRQVGFSFQDTATFLTILAKNGLRGADSGTSLRTALIRLINPSKAATESFKKLGISIRDAQGNIRPDVFIQIVNAASKLGPAQRDATIALIGGQDAFRAISILGRQSAASFLALRAELRQTGTAADLAAARNQGLKGSMDALQSTLETVGTSLASHIGPAMADFVRTVAAGINSLSQNQQVLGVLNQALATTTSSFNVLGVAVKTFGAIALPVTSVLLNLTNSVSGVQLAGSILTVVVAFKLLRSTIVSLAATKIASFFTILVEDFNKARVASVAAAEGNAILASSFVGLRAAASAAFILMGGWVTVALAAAGALYFLGTRATGLETATKNLNTEVGNLAGALGRLTQAREALASAGRDVTTSGTAIQQAQINAAIAQQDALNSTAPKGSTEQQQLLLSLKVATQNVTFATQDYKKALENQKLASDENAAASAALRLERQNSRNTLDKLISESIHLGKVLNGQRLGNITGFVNSENNARFALIATIKKQAAADLLSQDSAKRSIGLRETLIVQMVQRSKLPLAQLQSLLENAFSSKTLQSALSSAATSFGIVGTNSVRTFVKNVQTELANGTSLAKAIRDALKKALEAVTPTSESGGREQANAFLRGYTFQFQANTPALSNAAIVALTGAQKLALAQAQGASNAVQLAIAQKNESAAAAALTKAQAKFKKSPTAANSKALDVAIAAKTQADNDLTAIEGAIKTAATDAATKIKTAQDKADQVILDAITKHQTKIENKILAHPNDLNLQKVLLQFFLNTLARVKKSSLTAKAKADEIATLTREIIEQRNKVADAIKAVSDALTERFNVRLQILEFTGTLNQIVRLFDAQINQLTKALAKAKKGSLLALQIREEILQTQQDLFSKIQESLQLDVDFFVSKGNKGKEISARERLIKELQREQGLVGRGTVEWKRLRNLIEEQKKAIADTTQANKSLFAELSFAFLTTQQGFSATLLGNLLPSGAFGNTVATKLAGKVTDQTTAATAKLGSNLQSATRDAGDAAAARARLRGEGRTVGDGLGKAGGPPPIAGPTRGQQSIELDLLRQILRAIQHLSGATKHPENKQALRLSRAELDVRGD